MLHRLKMVTVQQVFEAAYSAVKGENVNWLETEEWNFGYQIVDSANRVTVKPKIIIMDRPPHRLETKMQIDMWKAQYSLKCSQVERLYTELIDICNGALTGVRENGVKVFKLTEAEMNDLKSPLLAQINHFKEKAAAAELNYQVIQEVSFADISAMQKEVAQYKDANNILREAVRMKEGEVIPGTTRSKAQAVKTRKEMAKAAPKKKGQVA